MSINLNRNLCAFAAAVLLASVLGASALSASGKSKYAGQEDRAIKSLSADDIAELRRGGGWGLAKSAELNGVPGPAHLLELKEAIPLSAAQIDEITQIYDQMKARAIAEGARLIALEEELEAHFRNATIDEGVLRQSLRKIADARMRLRLAHLSAHLKTPGLLSHAQMARYSALRGYKSADPCENVPTGHDPSMWRKHNGCR